MSYDTFEASIQDGKPVYKFLFSAELTEYRYTTASYFISDSSGTWEPSQIRATSVKQTGEMAKNGVNLTLPRTNAVAQLFLGRVPENPTSVVIYRGHDPSDLSDFQIYWRGRVASAEAGGDAVTLQCEDIFTSMQRPGNRARYQKGCRHSLYSPQCGVNDYDFAVPVEIVGQSGRSIVVSGITDSTGDSTSDLQGSDYFVGGSVELNDGARRFIEAQSGSTLTLMRVFSSIDVDSVGVSAILYPGCKHNTTDCKNKFNNLANFGGFPYIPGKNPFANSVNGSIV